MRQRRSAQKRRRALEFEAFCAGAAGRLLHVAHLLTAEPPDDAPQAERLLVRSLARTYAGWDRLRGEDPYEAARQQLVSRYAQTAWRYRRSSGGLLDRLSPQERLVLVLRMSEGVAEEQTAAVLGLPPERVHQILLRASAAMLSRRPPAAGRTRPEVATP